jgi:2-dehydro-3-deoxyphosphooctonate aldolase (KDO 8-P synthase)
MENMVNVNDILIGNGAPLVLIAGPCVIESYHVTATIAAYLADLTRRLSIPLIFKASYDKANRTSIDSFRGPGIAEGLDILARIKTEFGLPVLSDVHHIDEIKRAAKVLDVIQIPALLCRQTDFILEASKTKRPVNIKKGQFLAPWDVAHVVEKVKSTGNQKVMITERGFMFGYNNLIVDFRGIPIMQQQGCPVIFDATHSVQLPGGAGNKSGGQREFAPVLARAAVAAGVDGIFLEVHPDPDKAFSDGANSLSLDSLPDLLMQLAAIRAALRPRLAPADNRA